MARSKAARTASDNIADIEDEISRLMGDLEVRVSKLNTLTKNGASQTVGEARDFVSETVQETVDRLRNGVHTVGEEASRMGNDALRRVEEEVEQRPLLILAIAAGIGFLAGMAGRRS